MEDKLFKNLLERRKQRESFQAFIFQLSRIETNKRKMVETEGNSSTQLGLWERIVNGDSKNGDSKKLVKFDLKSLMEATKAGQSEILDKIDDVDKNASDRHDQTTRTLAHLESIIMESVKKSEKNHQELLEETKAAKSMGTRQLFLETSDNHNNNNVTNVVEDQSVADSALTDTTSATSAAQRQLQKVKQMKREIDAKKKRMDAQHEEDERKLLLREKRLDEMAENKLKKKEREYQTEIKKLEARLKAKDDQMKRGKSKSLKVLIYLSFHSQYSHTYLSRV